MSSVNKIKIKLGVRPWEFHVLSKTPESLKHRRTLTDSQIVLAFLLVALFMPRGLSQRAQYEWLLDTANTAWGFSPFNRFYTQLDWVSKTTLERYLHLAHEAELTLADGSTGEPFGEFVQRNLEDMRKAMPLDKPIYYGEVNADWITNALGWLPSRPGYHNSTVTPGTTNGMVFEENCVTPTPYIPAVTKKAFWQKILSWFR